VAEPNLFQLSGRDVHVEFSTTGIDGNPHFSYHDAMRSEQFTGEDIEIVDTAAGRLVSVTILQTPDLGTTSFSVLIPAVNLEPIAPLPIHTRGITTIHRSGIAPGLVRGQLDLYTVVRLTGTASLVEF
jgi:hypothetical protein